MTAAERSPGPALAFLLKGRQRRSRLNFRPFTGQVDELSSGSTKEEFHAIVRRVIEVANSGQTRIQTAARAGRPRHTQEGPCLRADVMLITDGISRLTENPFREENLHTFLIGDLMAEDKSMEIVHLLREWSRTFRCVWLSRYKDLLRPALGDIQAADRQLQALAERATQATEDEAARLHRMLENVKFLIAQWKQAAGRKAPVPAELRAIEEGLAATAGRLPPAPASPGESGGPRGRPRTTGDASARFGPQAARRRIFGLVADNSPPAGGPAAARLHRRARPIAAGLPSALAPPRDR